MKFQSVFVSLILAFLAAAQTIEIGYPTNGAVLHAGAQLTAEIDRPDSIIGCTEVGIALAMISCANGPCPPPSQQLGNVLYAGPFNPQGQPGGRTPFYQNFSVTVPSFSAGQALFTLTHLCLLGAGPAPLLEFRTATVTIASSY